MNTGAGTGGADRQICKYFVNGACTRGDQCPFLHEMPDERHLDVHGVGFIFNANVHNPKAAQILAAAQQSSKPPTASASPTSESSPLGSGGLGGGVHVPGLHHTSGPGGNLVVGSSSGSGGVSGTYDIYGNKAAARPTNLAGGRSANNSAPPSVASTGSSLNGNAGLFVPSSMTRPQSQHPPQLVTSPMSSHAAPFNPKTHGGNNNNGSVVGNANVSAPHYGGGTGGGNAPMGRAPWGSVQQSGINSNIDASSSRFSPPSSVHAASAARATPYIPAGQRPISNNSSFDTSHHHVHQYHSQGPNHQLHPNRPHHHGDHVDLSSHHLNHHHVVGMHHGSAGGVPSTPGSAVGDDHHSTMQHFGGGGVSGATVFTSMGVEFGGGLPTGSLIDLKAPVRPTDFPPHMIRHPSMAFADQHQAPLADSGLFVNIVPAAHPSPAAQQQQRYHYSGSPAAAANSGFQPVRVLQTFPVPVLPQPQQQQQMFTLHDPFGHQPGMGKSLGGAVGSSSSNGSMTVPPSPPTGTHSPWGGYGLNALNTNAPANSNTNYLPQRVISELQHSNAPAEARYRVQLAMPPYRPPEAYYTNHIQPALQPMFVTSPQDTMRSLYTTLDLPQRN